MSTSEVDRPALIPEPSRAPTTGSMGGNEFMTNGITEPVTPARMENAFFTALTGPSEMLATESAGERWAAVGVSGF